MIKKHSIIGLALISMAALNAHAQLVTNGLYLHLTADDLALTDGALVTSWTDSVSSNEFTNVDGVGTEPTYVADFANGHAAVLFDGVDDFLQDPTLEATGLPHTASLTAFVVGSFVSIQSPAANYMVSAQNGSVDLGDNRLRVAVDSAQLDWRTRVGDGGNLDTPGDLADTNKHLFCVVSGQDASDAVKLLVDDELVRTGTHGTTGNCRNLNRVNLGAFSNVTDPTKNWANVHIAELLIYNRALTDAEIAQVNAFLLDKYGLGEKVVGTLTINSVTAGSPHTVELAARVPAGYIIESDFFLNSSTDLVDFVSLFPADYSVTGTDPDGAFDIITIETDTAEPGTFFNISDVVLP